MIKTCLIANRGEIACRIIKTAKKLQIRCIVIYSTIDQHSLAVQLADRAVCIGGTNTQESYLNQEAILKIALENQVDAIHPGYGFLSENAEFARRCENASILFVGPSADTIEKMGSKAQAKQIMEKAGIPCIPGNHGNDQSDFALLSAAKKIGFPVLIKASLGGGGKGMRIVHTEAAFLPALQSARREAKQSVADDHMLLEKYFENPRHIEIQIAADKQGNIVHLFDRDCSLQRRQQKIIEEAPAPFLSTQTQQQLRQAAIKAAKAVDYVNLGTIEFLVSDQNVYFMEMNTRLQVEHPVTDMITQQDLVEWQFHIADDHPLPLKQSEIQLQGHAVEARIYAEDPENQFLPSTGDIHYLQAPELNETLRLDQGIQQGDQITVYYDPLLAKLIAWGKTRVDAIDRLKEGLSKFKLAGLKTNINFLSLLLNQTEFQTTAVSTQFIQKNIEKLIEKLPQVTFISLVFAALSQYKKIDPGHFANAKFRDDERKEDAKFRDDDFVRNDPWAQQNGWRLVGNSSYQTFFCHDKQTFSIVIETDRDQLHLFENNYFHSTISFNQVNYNLNSHQLYASTDQKIHEATVIQDHDQYTIFTQGNTYHLRAENLANHGEHQEQHALLTSPMPGTVIQIFVEFDQIVKQGDPLLIIEAMKMEHTITAPFDGKIETLNVKLGQQVQSSAELLILMEEHSHEMA